MGGAARENGQIAREEKICSKYDYEIIIRKSLVLSLFCTDLAALEQILRHSPSPVLTFG